jgi:hypothetical protein
MPSITMIVGMMKPKQSTSVAAFCPRPHVLIATIRRLAAQSGNVSFSDHALDRMEERDLTTLDVVRALRIGDIAGNIEAGNGMGEWKCKVVERRKRARDIGVATIVMKDSKLFIKTVEWEDK